MIIAGRELTHRGEAARAGDRLPPLDDAALQHAMLLVDELRTLVQTARSRTGAGRVGRLEEAIVHARAVSATLRAAVASARDHAAAADVRPPHAVPAAESRPAVRPSRDMPPQPGNAGAR